MNNIVKSQIYQLKKDRLILSIFILVAVIEIIQVTVGEGACAESASDFIGMIGSIPYSVIYMFVAVLIARVCGADFGDKTFNYEIMSGHTRRETYISRAGISIIAGVAGVAVLANLSIVLATLIHGFGTKISVGTVVLHQVLCIFPMIRIMSFFIFLIFAIRNQYIVMLLGFLTFSISELLGTIQSYVLSITNLAMLCRYESFSTFALSGGEYYVYEGSLSISTIVLTIVISLVMSTFWLYVGYVFYQKDDL